MLGELDSKKHEDRKKKTNKTNDGGTQNKNMSENEKSFKI